MAIYAGMNIPTADNGKILSPSAPKTGETWPRGGKNTAG